MNEVRYTVLLLVGCHYFIKKLEAVVLFMTIGSDTGLEHNCKVTRLPSTSSVCLVFV